MKVALIPCGTTAWNEEGRILGRVELSLTAAGHEECGRWAQQLHALGLKRVFHAPDELASRTAALVSRQLSVPTKVLDDLVEVDVGLWAGLTESQLKTRYASAHRELCESPLNVNPPGGESLSGAAQRLNSCVDKQLRRNNAAAIGLVMRPFSLAMAKCALEGADMSKVWELSRGFREPVVVELGDVIQPQAVE